MRAAPAPEVATATADALFQHFGPMFYIYTLGGGNVHNEATRR